MTALQILIGLIKRFEGCRLTAYRDCVGVLTIGYGHTGNDVHVGSQWLQSDCDAVLEHDAHKALNAAIKASPVLEFATPGQQAAIASLIYNVGVGGYTGHSVKPLIDNKLWQNAAVEIKRFDHVLLRLAARRLAESNLLVQ